MIDSKPKRIPIPEDDFKKLKSGSEGHDEDSVFALVLRDGLDLPIKDLHVQVSLPSGEVIEGKTSENGVIAVTLPEGDNARQGKAPVAVKDLTGQMQTVCELDLSTCNDVVIRRSPKVMAKVKLQPHNQASQASQAHRVTKPAPTAVAKVPDSQSPSAKAPIPTQSPVMKAPAVQPATSAVQATAPNHSALWVAPSVISKIFGNLERYFKHTEARPKALPSTPHIMTGVTQANHPGIAVLGPECPNPDNLRLGFNNIYRASILEASKLVGVSPHGICALISCEASPRVEIEWMKNSDGTPILNKQGQQMQRKVPREWNEKSFNTSSNAAGLTQFIASTWANASLQEGTFLHKEAIKRGFVKRVTQGAKNRWEFTLANGTSTATITQHIKSAKNNMSETDPHVQRWLDLRFDAHLSIMAAADYGRINLAVLRKSYKLDELNDIERAKLMYLMHHEGEPNGPRFLRNELGQMGTARLRNTFYTQFGAKYAAQADYWINKADGDLEKAYRAWLSWYIDERFVEVGRFFCQPTTPPKKLSTIFEIIGAKVIAYVPPPKN